MSQLCLIYECYACVGVCVCVFVLWVGQVCVVGVAVDREYVCVCVCVPANRAVSPPQAPAL